MFSVRYKYTVVQRCNTNKYTTLIKHDVLIMLPTFFGLNRPSSGQYFTEITGNYNMSYILLKRLWCLALRSIKFPVISVKYCHDDGLFRPKNVGNIINTSCLINIVHLLVLHRCSLMNKMHGKTHIKLLYLFLMGNTLAKNNFRPTHLCPHLHSGLLILGFGLKFRTRLSSIPCMLQDCPAHSPRSYHSINPNNTKLTSTNFVARFYDDLRNSRCE
jgi:hypothetical protein